MVQVFDYVLIYNMWIFIVSILDNYCPLRETFREPGKIISVDPLAINDIFASDKRKSKFLRTHEEE